MQHAEGLELLERGGALRHGHFHEAGGHTDLRLEKYNGLIDPAGTSALATALAEVLSSIGADVVLVWQDLEDLVLGFAVASQLGCGLVRAYNADGLVGHTPELPGGARAILVTDEVRDANVVRAVGALLEVRSSSLLGVGALVDAGRVEGVSVTSLVRIAPTVYPPADCPLCQQGVPLEVTARGRSVADGIS